ncbi:thiol reductant ABC exporter subunit CydC [Mycobacterium antarcticum]|uniref:ATP-binding cassette domain-containing protein n=1 Tax=Mycolicibacterium sp. TUM20985 TaxID=3023370 RepID=UPI0025728B3E|nr:ATP-binding cassette domain-containing protein [Mycolicibacterium sp. TUM20985]BDX32494.1 thiol reductant ABC exporter subunit CydC [Mycolicibacterium sp. TUM20985]
MRSLSASERRAGPLIAGLTLLRPRLPRLAIAVAFGVLALGSALTLAGVSAWLIAKAWQMPPILDLSVAVVAVRALGISRGVLGYCERLASHDTALRAAGATRARLYRTLAQAPADVVMRLSQGDIASRVGASVDELSDVLVRAVLPVAVAAILSTAAVAVIAVISPPAAAILALCLFIAGVVAPWLAARAAAAAEEVAAVHHSARDSSALLALEHASELRVAGRLDEVIAVAARRQHEWGAAADRAARPAAFGAATPVAAMGAAVLGTVIVGIALAPVVTPTTLAILVLLPLAAFEATTALPAAALQLVRGRIATLQLLALTAPAPESRLRPRVEVPVVAEGGRLAIVGDSGCGKTTTLMALAADHQDPLSAGFFPEDAHLFDTTVRDNLLVARGDADDRELVAALHAVGLGDWLDDLPDGLATMLTGGAAAVSAGQRRRLLLARAVLCDLPVLLLDEPTEHLDAADAERILRDVLTPGALFPAGRTVVVATHHLPRGVTCPVIYPRQT